MGGPDEVPSVLPHSPHRRGGGEAPTYTSVQSGPPSSTLPPHKDFTVGGSIGGFIGLVSGLAVFVVVALILGIYLWNRFYRRRIGSKRRSIRNVIPSLSFSGPTPDPYASPISPGDGADNRSYPSRPGAFRNLSGASEWELQSDSGLSPVELEDGYGGKGKGKARAGSGGGPGSGSAGSFGYMGVGMGLPAPPSEAALPIRSRSPSARSASEWSNHSGHSSRSANGKSKGKDRLVVNTAGAAPAAGVRSNDVDMSPSEAAPVNPFDSPLDVDSARASPVLLVGGGSDLGAISEERRGSGASEDTIRSPDQAGPDTGGFR